MFKESQKMYQENAQYVLPVIGFEEPVVDYGKGVYIYDVDGNEILDMSGGQFCTIFGHAFPEIDKLYTSISKIQHTNTATLSSSVLRAYKNLASTMANMNPRIITLSTGAEAIEFALRYAKNYTGKNGLVCFDKGYHGLSLGAQAITYGGVYSNPRHKDIFTIPVIEEHFSHEEIDIVTAQLESICKSSDNIAAMFFEPIVGVGGIHKLTSYFMNQVREICNIYNIFLVFDECQSGFGRGGSWWYYQTLGVSPDILVTAKGIGLGFPVSLVAVNADTVDTSKTLTHYSSHQNDPFSAEIIQFGIEYMRNHSLIEEVQQKGVYLRSRLLEIANVFSCVSTPRGDGLLVGFDFAVPGLSDYRQLGVDFRRHMCYNGVLVQGTNGGKTIRLLPSYLITKEEIDQFLSVLVRTLENFDFGGYGD